MTSSTTIMRAFFKSIFFFFFLIPLTLASSFTSDQVAQHHSLSNCYMIISGKVYDVTSYVNQHPGGVDTIVSGCGTDATDLFAQIHSQKAYDLLPHFYIGDLSINQAINTDPTNTIAMVPQNNANSSMLAATTTFPLKPKLFVSPSAFDRYPFIIPVTILWIFIYCGYALARKLWPKIFMRLGLLRMTSFIMLISFLGVGIGGLNMLFNGIGGTTFGISNSVWHAFFGYVFILMAFSHIIIHRRDLWGYLKKAVMKKKNMQTP
jgi:hypothetical protein